MAKKANGRAKSWQQLSREVDRSAAAKVAAKKVGPKTARAMATHFPGHKSAKPRKGGKPKPPADPMDREVPVKLGPDAIKIREHELAEKVLLRNRLVAELRDTAKAKRGEIEALTARINQLAEICTDGVDNVRQGDLRFGQEVAGAAQVLGKTAKTIEEAALEKGALTEAMDAAEADIAAAASALPSQPHKFAPLAGLQHCDKCGGEKDDPVHDQASNGAGWEPHVFETGPDPDSCLRCSYPERDLVHTSSLVEANSRAKKRGRSVEVART